VLAPTPLLKTGIGTARMKVLVRALNGETLDFDVDSAEPMSTLKCLIESVQPDLGTAGSMQFTLKGQVLTDDNVSLNDVQYQEGDTLVLGGAVVPEAAPSCGMIKIGQGPKVPLTGRPGAAPSVGLQAVQITVSDCTNAKCNGVYLPAAPHSGKPVWYKAPSEEEMVVDGESASKDRGERVIYFRTKEEKWFIGDDLDAGGFTFVHSAGQSPMPPLRGWYNKTVLEVQISGISDGDLNPPAVLSALASLNEIQPWADQETCYVTMLKVLGNIAANPGEAKFCSLKVENAAIQNKILRFNGARGFLEAAGFRESAGALVLPTERGAQAKMAHELLQGHANDANYENIRKERAAKAAEEIKKEAAKPKARTYGGGKEESGGGPRFGQDRMGGGKGGGG